MKKEIATHNSPSSVFWFHRNQDAHLTDVFVQVLTKLGFVLIGLVALLVLSLVGWGYGVVQNGVITGLPRRCMNHSNGNIVSKAF